MIFIKTENGPVLYYFHKTALTYQFKAENIDIPQSYVFQSNVENARENLDNIKLWTFQSISKENFNCIIYFLFGPFDLTYVQVVYTLEKWIRSIPIYLKLVIFGDLGPKLPKITSFYVKTISIWGTDSDRFLIRYDTLHCDSNMMHFWHTRIT